MAKVSFLHIALCAELVLLINAPAVLSIPVSSNEVTDALENMVEQLYEASTGGNICTFIANILSQFTGEGLILMRVVIVELSLDAASNIGLFQVFPIPGSSNFDIPLDTVTFDCESNTLTVTTRPYGSQTIIPDVLEIDNTAFSLSVDITDIDTLVIAFTGQWSIAGASLDVQAMYSFAIDQYQLTASSGQSVDIVSLASELTGLDLPNPFGEALTFDTFIVSGVIYADRTSTLIVRAASQIANIYLIYHKPSQTASQKAIVAEFSNFRLSSLITEVTGIDLSGVPYFGSLTTPRAGLTIATAGITGLPEETFTDSDYINLRFIENENTIPNGKWGAVQFNFFEAPLKVNLNSETSFEFEPLADGLSVDTLLSIIPGVDFNSIPIPFNLDPIRDIGITSFSLGDDDKTAVCIEAGYNNGLSFFNGKIDIKNADINLCLSKQPTKVRVEVSGEMRVGSMEFAVELFLDENENYVIQASANSLPITSALSHFQASVLPSELNSLLSNIPFVSFSVRNPRLTYPLSSVPQQIQVGGTPVVAGYRIIRADIVIIRGTTSTSIIEGFELGSVNLADILQTISGSNFFNSIALLNQDLDAAILISPVTLPNLQLQGGRLQDFAITRGVSVQAEMSFPDDCSDDPFCAVAQFLLGENARLSLRGTVQSVTRFALFAGVSDISVGSGLTISNAGLEVEATGTTVNVGITGSIILSDPPITLTSRIFLSTSGVVLEMSMGGCWLRAFGVDWLGICNIVGSIGMIPGVLITSLEIGGVVRLGDPSCSTPITAIGFLGVDALTPANNYYYVQFTDTTTVASLFASLCVNINLPRPLGESGFPHGFLSSFSLFGQELSHIGISIPAGFRLNGTLNILGLEGSADITINLPDGIKFNVALPPINIGNGLLRMSVSQRDASRGPFLRANIVLLPSPNVDIEASGYVRVLGISQSASLRITNTRYELSISGKMLNLFKSDLMISASYGRLNSASFRVKGSFKNDLYDKIEKEIKDALEESADEATNEINRAQRKIDQEEASFDSANRDLLSAERAVDNAQSEFNSVNRALQNARDDLNRICTIRSCSQTCIPCISGTSCCGKIFGTCVCHRPNFDDCCTRVTDPSCLTANEACRGLIATAQGAVSAAQGAVSTARDSLDAAEVTLQGARGAVNTARLSLDAANLALEAASATYRVASQAAQRIATIGLNGLISIREISFDVLLSVANGGSFSGSVRASFLGQAQVTISLNINLRDITSMAKQLADEIGDGFSSLF